MRRLAVLILVVTLASGAAACSSDGSDGARSEPPASTTAPEDAAADGPAGYEPVDGFDVWVGEDETPDVDATRLCDETDTFTDPDTEKHDITCRFEGSNFAAEAADPDAESLVVMTWNMERNYELAAQIDAFQDGTIPVPDVLLASEVDRGCDRSDRVNGGWEFAEAVGLNYVYGVEFVEGVRDDLSTPCEHGQAIFSRYPIGNVELFRHVNTGTDRYDNPGEPRIGTRADLEADIAVGDRLVHVVSVHYDDQVTKEEDDARTGQAQATARRGLDHDIPTIIGGDMNTAFYLLDATPASTQSRAAKAFWDAGWHDTHAGVEGRITVPFEINGAIAPGIVDLLWVRDPDTVEDPSWCAPEDCEGLSDHLPQWITWKLPAA